jgi:hypothetical protein
MNFLDTLLFQQELDHGNGNYAGDGLQQQRVAGTFQKKIHFSNLWENT